MQDDHKPNTDKDRQDSTPAGEDITATLAELKAKLELVEKERDEYLNGWRRTKADFVNYKQEELARLEETAKFGSEELIKDLVSVLANFDLALAAFEKQGVKDGGVAMIRSQFEELLKRRGLSEIEVALGKEFDPAREEVVTQSEDARPPGTVLEVLARGFTLHGRVVKPARVRVSQGPNN